MSCSNMKKKCMVILLVQLAMCAHAQMLRWTMRPAYEKISLASGVPLLLSDSLGTTALWDFNGKKLAQTTDRVHDFHEGLAVVTKRGSDDIYGVYQADGKLFRIDNFKVAHGYPYYADGYLLAKQNQHYFFLDKEGNKENFGLFINMYPFVGGLASCFTYEDFSRLKNPYYTFISVDKQPVVFSYKNKMVDKEDVEFLSSLSDEGKALVIIKHKLFYYDHETRMLSPVMTDEDDVTKRKQLYVDGHVEEFKTENNDSIYITARGNKKDVVTFVFDEICRPVKAIYPNNTIGFTTKKPVEQSFPSSLRAEKSSERFGLKHGNDMVLYPQLEDCSFGFIDNMVVKMNGKWGLLTYDPSIDFRVRFNKGNDIAFRHRTFETVVRVDLPSVISSKDCQFTIDPRFGCEIDKTSIQSRDTENGNYVQYNCILTIPDSLPDVLTDVIYPVHLSYDGLVVPAKPVTVKAWHYKYISVDLSGIDTEVSKGNVAFILNVTVEKNPGDPDYPFEVAMKSSSTLYKLEKLSECRYKCRLFSLKEGSNPFTIEVTEKGCMPSVFPFELTYVKPSRNDAKEAVSIKKLEDATTMGGTNGSDGQQPAIAPEVVPSLEAPAAIPLIEVPADSIK